MLHRLGLAQTFSTGVKLTCSASLRMSIKKYLKEFRVPGLPSGLKGWLKGYDGYTVSGAAG